MMRRDRDNPMPLYHQLAAHLREQIRTGALPPGTRLAAETTLSQEAGVSRMTARQAIGVLVADGLVVVRHGVGTFVAEPRLTYDALHLLGFSETLAAHGGAGRTSSDVLEQLVEEATPDVARELGLEVGESVVKVRRIRCANGEPLVLETSYLPASICADLEGADLAGRSLYALLESDFGLRLAGARQHFAARPASDAERDLLRLPTGGCVLVAWGVSDDDNGRPVEYFEAVYRADRCQFAVSSRRPAGSGRLGDGTDRVGRAAPALAAADAVPLHVVLTDTDQPSEPPH